MHESLLLEGDEYIFDKKVERAFHKGGEYVYRYGGVDFLENQTVRIWIREVFGGMFHGKESKPFSFEMKWNKRTSVKKILESMRENGYGTRNFELVEKIEPEQAKV